MIFPFNAYLLALLAGGLASFATLPFWRKWCERVGVVDDPGHRKIHQTRIPLAGGLAVFTGLLVPLLFGALAVHLGIFDKQTTAPLNYGFGQRKAQLLGIFAGALGMLMLGFADDKWELKPAAKFTAQLLIASIVAFCGVRITLFVPNLVFSYLITILWILTVTNALNFMDNMNGLCAGLGFIAAFQFGTIAATRGQYLVALFSFCIAGALLGFLPHNYPKASAFLGDSGSHLVGFLLAVLAILPHFYTSQRPRTLAVFAPLFILAVPLGDLLSVVIWRLRNGKPFYIGDNNHLSHRLTRSGCQQPKAVLIIWALSLAVGLFALV